MFIVPAATATGAVATDSIARQAALFLSFDEESGNPMVRAAGVEEPLEAMLVNAAGRVSSPFWNQSGKQAMAFDATKKQSVQLTDIPYVDRPDAVTLSCLFLNLHPLDDEQFHGIVAKRSAGKNGTNYGINYQPKNDSLQLYVHDGSGFKTAVYSARTLIGYRRLVHLTATFEVGVAPVGDAPANDADTDRDDLLVRLFVNGEQAAPKSVNGGFSADADAWLTDVQVARLLNDVPLTIGSSTSDSEFTSGLIDEFYLFTRALSPEEAGRLFVEVSGENAAELARREAQQPSLPAKPEIRSTSLRGLQAGLTTRLTIVGRNLAGDPRVVLPVAGLKQTAVPGSQADRLIVDLAIPADAPPGIYPFNVQTNGGISNMLPVAVDRLPQLSADFVTRESPASLPAAFSGTISGDERVRIHFFGYAGQRIVADVEARRLGAEFEPVLEVKTAAGTPQAIEWGKVFLRGDTRAELILPENGLYAVELHDLAYKAPAASPFRLKVGDIKMIDACFPPAAAANAELNVEPVGTGLPPGTVLAANLKDAATRVADLLWLPPQLGPTGPAPAIRVSDGVELIETPQPGDQLQTVTATFAEHAHTPVFINGRILQPDETDRYLLEVTPGQKLSLSIDARAIDSPLDGQLLVLSHPGGQKLASSNDRPGTRDPGLEYTVPENARHVQVAVRDLHGHGGSHYLYRLRVVPAGQPSYSIQVQSPNLSLPVDGSAVARLQVNRSGYQGPISLSVLGDECISISPSQLPAEGGNRTALVTLKRNETAGAGELRELRILAESVALDPPIRRVATISDNARPSVPAYDDRLPTALTPPVHLSVDVVNVPEALLKGLDSEVSVQIEAGGEMMQNSLRLSLISTEKPRLVDQRDRKKGNKPLILAVADQSVSAGATKGVLKLAVPNDVGESAVDFVIRADVVLHPYSERVLGTVYSEPFRLPVRDAVAANVDEESLKIQSDATGKIRGTLKRTPPFRGSVELALTGLPENYSAKKVTLPADQEQFEIEVTAPQEAEPINRDGRLEVTTADGRKLRSQRIRLRVMPAAKQ